MKKILGIIAGVLFIIGLTFVFPQNTVQASTYAYDMTHTENPYYDGIQIINGEKQVRCTYVAWQEAKNRLGISLGSWGNAKNWYASAAGKFERGSTPRANSIYCSSYGTYGHVAYVTSVSGSTISIIEGGHTGVVYPNVYTGTRGEYSNWAWHDDYFQGFIYLDSSSNKPPTYASVSIAKTNYAVTENVTFNISADGDATTLWIYCPNGQTLTYQNVGATFSLGFGMSGYYEGLVETWNGVGSKQSSRISWRVGKPTICNLSIAKSEYAVDEKVTFNMKVDGEATTLWIYCPDGKTLIYQNVGATYSLGFGKSGHYEALAETWNGIGSKQSAKVSWNVGKPTICNLSIAKSEYAVDEKVTFNMKADGNATTLWIYCPDGQTLIYQNVGATYSLGFGKSGHYEALAETWNGIGSKQSAKVSWDVKCNSHSWGSGKITKAATTTATGVKTFTCTVCGKTKTETIPKLAKKANPLKIKVSKITYKQSVIKNKAQSFSIGVSKAQGNVTYTLDAKAKKAKIKVSKKGKATIPKNCKKGTYKITVKAAGNKNYKAGSKTVTIKIK